ncbi:MAG: LemA family protein [Pseudomonadota bacterium]
METNTIIALVAGAFLLIFIITTYNGIINRKNAVKRAWSDVITQERQKNKILPELQKSVDQYTGFESGLQSKITQLRSKLNELQDNAPDAAKLQQVEKLSEKVMHGIQVSMEAYPDLKASELFNNLMREISEQQEHIGAAIRIFNYNVEQFNNGIQNFPANMVNGMLNKEVQLNTFTDTEASEGFEFRPNL